MLENEAGTDVLMFPLLRVFDDASLNHLDYQFVGETVVEGKAVIRDLGLYVWCAPRFVFKRALMENQWLFFPIGLLHEDEYFGPVLVYLAKSVHVYDGHIYNRLIHAGSIMTSVSIRSSYDTVAIHHFLMDFMDKVVETCDREWFRRHCFDQLYTSYSINWDRIGTPEFSRFARKNGVYVWRQWRFIHREASFKRKMGRLFYFTLPGLRRRMMQKYSRRKRSI